MSLPEIIQLGGTGALVAVLAIATRYQTQRLAETQREQIELLRTTVGECSKALNAVKDALDGCRARTEALGDTRHFRKPHP